MSKSSSNDSDNGTSRTSISSQSPNLTQEQQKYLLNMQSMYGETLETTKNLFAHNNTLASELDDARLDLESSTSHNRELQRRLAALTAQLSSVSASASENPYTQVLIDGDGLLFPLPYLTAGRTGGHTASSTLHAALAPYTPPSTPLHIKIFANLSGLSRHLQQQAKTLHDFATGFSDPCNAGFTDLINVGDGKELADEKLKAELRWHLKNRNCRGVLLLGVAHDNGYARVLSEVEIRTDSRVLVVIEQGRSVGREVEALGVRREKLKLWPDDAEAPPPMVTAPPGLPAVTKQVVSYAAAVTTTPPASPVQRKVERVKEREIPVTRDALLRIKALNPRPCNNFYLKDECMFEECRFGHEYNLKGEDIAAMRKLAKHKQCVWGVECSSEKCYYSHEPE